MLHTFEKFDNILQEYEVLIAAKKTIDTDKIIDIVAEFEELYRSLDLKLMRLRGFNACTRISIILSYWVNSNSELSVDELNRLLKLKNLLVSIYLSGFDADQKILKRSYDPKNNYKQNLTKLLLLISINNLNQELFSAYLKIPEKHAFNFSVAWIGERLQMTKAARVYNQKLINNFERFKNLEIEPEDFQALCITYMYTTYSNSVGKDNIKSTINELISNTIKRYNSHDKITTSKKSFSEKLRLLIVHEKFSQNHVMVRCFLGVFNSLMTNVELIHVSCEDQFVQDKNNKISTIASCNGNFKTAIKIVKEADPDIILYPSLGMHPVAIMLSGLRLAPLQLQLFGHPSPSFSKEIDGSFLNSINVQSQGPEKCTQKIAFRGGVEIEMETGVYGFNRKHTPISDVNGKTSICVNGKSMKLSPAFMEFLSKILWPDNIQINFFPGEQGCDFIKTENLIRQFFPTCIVHPLAHYSEYLVNLSTQDLAICPFPFGNTNGIVDSIKIGLPTFALKGKDICSAGEMELLITAGLEEFLFDTEHEMNVAIAKFLSEDEYKRDMTDLFRRKSHEFLIKNDPFKAREIRSQDWLDWIETHVQTCRSNFSPKAQNLELL